jgi:hypothetical protein
MVQAEVRSMVRSYDHRAAWALAWLLAACSSQGPSPAKSSPASAMNAGSPSAEAATGAAGRATSSSAAGASAGGAVGAAPARAGNTAIAGAPSAAGADSGAAGSGAPPAAGTAPATAGAPGEPAAPPLACAAMVAAAKDFIASLDTDALKSAALLPFEAHHNFAYEPQVADRPGVSLAMMSDAQQQKALALVRAGLSEDGFERAETVRALENLKAVTGFQVNMRDPKYYWVALFGEPSESGAWAYQIEGHHLALHFTLKACAISDTPTFMGAWPAEVASMMNAGPPAGTRNLDRAEELGRALAKSLDADPSKRMQAFQSAAYRQMLPQGPDKAQPMMPAGLPASAMSDGERMQLRQIIEFYAGLMAPELAAGRLKRIEDQGGLQPVSFVWTGALEPKQRHFYRVQGPSFFIEYRNDDGDHIHSAWRDFSGDWGDDLP